MNKQEIIRELRQRKHSLEQTIDRCHDVVERMAGQADGYSVEKFTQACAQLRAAQCTLHSVKSRLYRLESGNAGSAMPIYNPVSIYQLQNQIRR